MKQRSWLRGSIAVVVALSLALIVAPRLVDADEISRNVSVGWPALTIRAHNPVQLGVVKAVALKKAREVWGQVVPGEPIPCADQDGNLAYYMVPFRFGTGAFPTHQHIMEGVRKGRDLAKAVEEGGRPAELMEVPREVPSAGKIVLHASTDVPPIVNKRVFTDASEMDHQTAHLTARKKEIGAGEYGTVVVAATYDRFPIPLYMDYLPPFYFKGDRAQEKATELLGGKAQLNRIYFLGMRGIYFEFSSGKRVLTLHASKVEPESFTKTKRVEATQQQEEYVRAAWKKLTQGGD